MSALAATENTGAALTSRERSNQNLRPWRRGESGNPGGRSPGLAKRIKEAVGEDGQKLVTTVVEVLEDPEATRRDRLDAASWLADRAFARPTQVVSGEDGGPIAFQIVSMLATARDQAAERRELEEGDGGGS